MKSQVLNIRLGNNAALGISSIITGDVSVSDNKYIPPRSIITNQTQADSWSKRGRSPFEYTNEAVADVNNQLSKQYDKASLAALAEDRQDQM